MDELDLRQQPVSGNLIGQLLRKHRSKKGLHEMKESHPPHGTPKTGTGFKSLTDVQTSDDCNNSSEGSSSCLLQIRVSELTEENRQLRDELQRFRQGQALNLCNSKLIRLVEETECLAKEVQSLRKKLEDCNVERDFYMRAYNNIKKDNEMLVKELSHRRKELEAARSELRVKDHSLSAFRKRTSSQSPKNPTSLKVKDQKNEEQSLQELIVTIKGEVQKASSLRYLEETLRKLEAKLEVEKKPPKESGQRKEYFPEYRESWENKHNKKHP